jgi:hypothetical protein
LRDTAPKYLAGIEHHFNRHLSAADRSAVERALTKVVGAHHAEMDLRR